MKYRVKNESIVVKSNTAINAIIKIIRRIILNQRIKNKFSWDLKDEIILVDEKGNESTYLFTIQPNEEDPMKAKYYFFDYKILLYKKMALK